MENQASEGILKSLDNKLDKMKDQIIQEGKEKARLIDEEAQKKLLQLKNKDKQLIESSDMIISIKQDLMTKKREWMAKFNSKRAQLVTKAFDTTKNQISQLHTRNKSFYSQLLVTLFLEVVDQIGDSKAIIHVPKGASKFISDKVPSCCTIQEDIADHGVILELLDHPIQIENTIESRLQLFVKEAELIINTLFKDLEEPPWQESAILDTLMHESMD